MITERPLKPAVFSIARIFQHILSLNVDSMTEIVSLNKKGGVKGQYDIFDKLCQKKCYPLSSFKRNKILF